MIPRAACLLGEHDEARAALRDDRSQTAKIAQHIAHRASQAGITIELQHAAEVGPDFDVAAFDGVVLGGSIHEGHYQRYLVHWIEQHRGALAQLPTALFTVCLAIRSVHAEERAQAEAFPAQLSQATGFVPTHSAVIAGALKYTEHSWLKRVVMRQITKKEGGDTDTSRDYEYIDWEQVDAFADAFFAEVQRRSRASGDRGGHAPSPRYGQSP